MNVVILVTVINMEIKLTLLVIQKNSNPIVIKKS